jgi:putative restriction endonuclease
VHNGLLLSALWDAAFDTGLVSFADDGIVLDSPDLSAIARTALGSPDLSTAARTALGIERAPRLPYLREPPTAST